MLEIYRQFLTKPYFPDFLQGSLLIEHKFIVLERARRSAPGPDPAQSDLMVHL
jgi:hypothetical protein